MHGFKDITPADEWSMSGRRSYMLQSAHEPPNYDRTHVIMENAALALAACKFKQQGFQSAHEKAKVGWCRLTLSNPRRKRL